jgi:hypothetical protein
LIRDTWLSNRAFVPYKDILDRCRNACSNRIDQPWETMPIGTRD